MDDSTDLALRIMKHVVAGPGDEDGYECNLFWWLY